jgi:hypothetical protein
MRDAAGYVITVRRVSQRKIAHAMIARLAGVRMAEWALPIDVQEIPMTFSKPNRFGSGKSIARVEDDAAARPRTVSDNLLPSGSCTRVCPLAASACVDHAHRRRRGSRDARCACGADRRDLARECAADSELVRLPSRRRSATMTAPHHALAVDTVRFVAKRSSR